MSPEVNQQADNDYYFAGIYTTVLEGNGFYDPVGFVLVNEEAAERAFAAADNDLRYHFNLPSTLQPTDLLSVTFDALNLRRPERHQFRSALWHRSLCQWRSGSARDSYSTD